MRNLKSIKVMGTLFKMPTKITTENFAEAMYQSVQLELATIPTYLSTYYSINRARSEDDQKELYTQIFSGLPSSMDVVTKEKLAQEYTLDVLVYANQSAALIMSVVIEEMLHLSLSSNVHQAIVGPPDIVGMASKLSFPTDLPGHMPEFQINADKLSLKQLKTFLQIESPNIFKVGTPEEVKAIDYFTIGDFYDAIIKCVQENYMAPYENNRPQLLPDQPFFAQNSINTVYYDREHIAQFTSQDDSGGMIGVYDGNSAIAAMTEIIDQGEGHKGGSTLKFDTKGMPVPLPVVNGKVVFSPEDYDDPEKEELSHFGKFMEVYSLGSNFNEKFKANGLDFFSYVVYNQAKNPVQADYANYPELALISKLGNAMFTYIILMVETCYYSDKSTQFDVFMYGIHKSMIWLLSTFGNSIHKYPYTKDGAPYVGSLTFEYHDFNNEPGTSPKDQVIELLRELVALDDSWSWLMNSSYIFSLPDVGLDHSVKQNVPDVPKA